MDAPVEPTNQCKAGFYKSGAYRATPNDAGRWTRTYNWARCSRPAGANGRCWQHQDTANYLDWDHQPAVDQLRLGDEAIRKMEG